MIVMARGFVWTPNVIVYQDGNHLLIAIVSQYCLKGIEEVLETMKNFMNRE